MADKKLNEVTKVTDMAYVPVIMSDGSIGQIAKADLASVVAGLMSQKDMSTFVNSPTLLRDLNEVKPNGVYAFALAGTDPNGDILGYDYGNVLYFKNRSGFGTFQMVCINNTKSDGDRYFTRRGNADGTWNNWQRIDNFGYNSLEELAAALKPKLGL